MNESLISMILGAIVIVVVGVLVINYFSTSDQEKNLLTGETTTSETTITRDGKTFHVVQPNDTLWTISEKYYDDGFEWTKIAEANGLTNPNEIEKGQELLIPEIMEQDIAVASVTDVPQKELSPTPTQMPTTNQEMDRQEATGAITGATYTVVGGDNLWDIAVRAYGDGYKWVEIAEANDLINPNLIHRGNVFIIPR